jgi:transposase
MADWLEVCGVETVAMESTGVYWVGLYQVLEARGFEVKLVNARHVKALPGRKTDVQDCQWLQKLHTFGLLNNSFRPEDKICVWRSLLRQRENLVQMASTCTQHMQKALTEMNVQLANVISDITGVTGMAIIRAILRGERDPKKLAKLRDPRVKASGKQIAQSLEGNWRDELLFVLKQSLELYETYQNKIADCDTQIEVHLASFGSKMDVTDSPTTKRTKKARGNAPKFDLHSELCRISGVDVTSIDGIDVVTAQKVISEIGMDMSKWKTEKNFASWLGLCPDNRITGGKVQKRGTRHVVNRASHALRMAASSLLRSNSSLGANYRRLRTSLGAPKAITAMAHKLARLVYRMLKYGREYVDKGVAYYEERFKQQKLRWLKRKAKELNCQIVPAQETRLVS